MVRMRGPTVVGIESLYWGYMYMRTSNLLKVIAIVCIMAFLTVSCTIKVDKKRDPAPKPAPVVAKPVEQPKPVVKTKPMTQEWKAKLGIADGIKTAGDDEYAAGGYATKSNDERIANYDKACEYYAQARNIYQSFCKEYKGFDLFGYDVKVSEIEKRIGEAKNKIGALKAQPKR